MHNDLLYLCQAFLVHIIAVARMEKWNRLWAAMHVFIFMLTRCPIKIVIAVNFKSENINKCHPFSPIVSFLSVYGDCISMYVKLSTKCNYIVSRFGCPPTRRAYTRILVHLHCRANDVKRNANTKSSIGSASHVCANRNGWHFLIVWSGLFTFCSRSCWWCCLPFTRMDRTKIILWCA